MTELDAVYTRLSENPYLYPIIHRGIRRAIVRRFPYGVFYLVAVDDVRVLAIVDMARNPAVWLKRTDK